MTTAETEMVLELLRTEYPHSFEKLTANEKAAKVKTWAVMLAEYNEPDVLKAIRTFIENDTKGFAPTFGQIRQHLEVNALPEADTADKAAAHYKHLRDVYKKITGRDYEPVDCVKEGSGYPKCTGCNEQTKCRPASEKQI
jgi:hypothetical protein